MKARLLWSSFSMVLILAGCGSTSSRVNKFLTEAETTEPIQKSIENYTGTINTSASEHILLQGSVVDGEDNHGQYTEYQESGFQTMINAGKQIIIVSDDDDCPDCRSLITSIQNSLSHIPADVVIMRMPLAYAQRQYELKDPNIAVYFNADGTVRYIAQGGLFTLDDILFYIK